MSQRVLSIDTTASPGQAMLLEVSGTEFTVLERHSIDLELSSVPERVEKLRHDSEVIAWEENPLLRLRSDLRGNWHFSSVLLLPQNHLTLNLTVPFSSAKLINQVIESEVADQVPMNIEDYHIQYDIRGQYNDLTEVRVQLIEKKLVDDLLYLFRQAQIEPSLMVTPGMLLPLLLPFTQHQKINHSHAILRSEDAGIVVSIFAQENYRCEHVFPAEDSLDEIAQSLNRYILWAEYRYKTKIDKVFFVGPYDQREPLERLLDRRLTFIILPPSLRPTEVMGTIAAVAAQEEAPLTPHGNIRTGSYRYNPLYSFAWRKMKRVIPFVVIMSLVVSLLLVSAFLFRQYQIRKYGNTIRAKIREVVSDLEVPEGSEAAGLRGKIRQLEGQLAAFSSFDKRSPLEPLTYIARHFPKGDDIELKTLSISDSRIRIKGKAPDHSTVENIKRELRKKRRYFCRIKKVRAAKTGDKVITFEYSIDLCDE